MPFIEKEFFLEEKLKAYQFLMKQLNLSMQEAQRVIAKKRLTNNEKIVCKQNQEIFGNVKVVIFYPTTNNLKPIFQTKDFAIFNKPSGILSHPNSRFTTYSILHEAKYLFGDEANIIHRLDKYTSGLIVVSKNKDAEKKLKSLFENRQIQKTYIAKVSGKIEKELTIDTPIFVHKDKSRLKVEYKENGKKAKTIIKPIFYDEKLDQTLVKAIPLTGRQHQIRFHLFHVEHPILGDHIYGQNEQFMRDFLDGKINNKLFLKKTGAKRLMLHAYSLEFMYNDIKYFIVAKENFNE